MRTRRQVIRNIDVLECVEGLPLAELERFFTRRERRSRRLAGLLALAVLAMAVLFVLSYKASIWDNDMANPSWHHFENNEGDTLAALVLKPEVVPPEGAPAVIVVHDLTGHKEQLNRLSFELARHGFIVMALDLRDHGRSGGNTTFGNYYMGEAYDIVAAYDYLLAKVDGVDPSRISMVGDGFGGAQAIMATDMLLRQYKNVSATVAWAPPMDIRSLVKDEQYASYWEAIEVYLERRVMNTPVSAYRDFWEYNVNLDERSAILHMDAPNWSASKVYIIYGDKDTFIPTDQFTGLTGTAETALLTGLDHGLSENDDVLRSTIKFIEARVMPGIDKETAFNYQKVEQLNGLLNVSIYLVMLLAFMLLYETAVMKKTSRSYIPEISKNEGLAKLGIYTLFDVVVYALIAFGASRLVNTLSSGMLMEILPGSRFFTVVLFAGALLLLVGFCFWYVEARIFKKDEERSDETCGNIMGIVMSVFVSIMIIIVSFLAGQILLTGPNLPKTFVYLIPTLVMLLFFMGHEVWMRKLLHPKINTMLGTLFIRRKAPFQITFFLVMYGLYAALMFMMFSAVGKTYMGPDFMRAYLVLVTAVGFVSTVIYHRSRSILASVTYSAVIAPWLLNLLYNF